MERRKFIEGGQRTGIEDVENRRLRKRKADE